MWLKAVKFRCLWIMFYKITRFHRKMCFKINYRWYTDPICSNMRHGNLFCAIIYVFHIDLFLSKQTTLNFCKNEQSLRKYTYVWVFRKFRTIIFLEIIEKGTNSAWMEYFRYFVRRIFEQLSNIFNLFLKQNVAVTNELAS